MGSNEYENQILQWRAKKYEERVGENGWLSLAGLSWLNPGRNLVGSNPMCEVTLPERAPTFLGIVEWKGKTVRLQVAEGVRVQVNGKLVQKTVLKSDQEAKPSFITWNQICAWSCMNMPANMASASGTIKEGIVLPCHC